jgi:hypothetical protein
LDGAINLGSACLAPNLSISCALIDGGQTVDAADACAGYSVIEFWAFFTFERVEANPRAKEWMRLRRVE